MSYIPLAVKYRPQKFSDLIGQQGTLKALTNGIALGREPRCLIFSGIRGVGKTTLARLYAMALNCEQPEGGEPCGHCGNCRAIQSGTHENVTEIDGASNTSVEDIRNLQETMSYVPQRGRFKVYIVDEVHMLSNSAFNAFLKTLEEPPEDVIFILATTELAKIPKTVQSRCQTFFLAKMSPDEIKINLARILDAEAISYQEGALQIVALEGQGSMRDALTFLDQVIAVSAGELTEELLAEFSQNLPFSACLDFLTAMMTKDGPALIAITEGWHDKGIDYRKTVAELIRIVRNASILASIGDSPLSRKSLNLSDGECEATLSLAKSAGTMDTHRIFRSLVSLYHQLDGSFLDRFLLENTSLEWCFDPGIMPSGPQGSQGSTAPSSSSSSSAGGPSGGSLRSQQSGATVAQTAPAPEPRRKPASRLSADFAAAPKPVAASKPAASTPTASTPTAVPPKPVAAAPKAVADSRPMQASPADLPPMADVPPPMAEFAPPMADVPPPMAEFAPPPAERAAEEPPAYTKPPEPKPLEPKPLEPKRPAFKNQEPKKQEPRPEPTEPAPARTQPQQPEPNEPAFPPTWRDFVARWAKAKPFLARIVEEAHVVDYAPEKIHLAVDPTSMAGSKLLATDKQQAFRQDFKTLFGFEGALEVMTLADYRKGAAVDEPLPETLLEVKTKEKRQKREDLVEKAKSHPLTQSALETFGGKIESIDILDDRS